MSSLKYWIKDIIKFLRDQDFDIDPLPKIVLDNSENDPSNLFIKTGYYDTNNQRIVLFINNRHIKDILRTLVHELVHHHQYVVDKRTFIINDMNGKLADNPELRKIEGQAYLLGNLYFRMYTEQFTKKES